MVLDEIGLVSHAINGKEVWHLLGRLAADRAVEIE
jgi:hypothetical protein